jgi:hypothetical protein
MLGLQRAVVIKLTLKVNKMNEETLALIDKLATKIGTTGEHLWGVLLKQAPISSTIELLILLSTVFFTYRFSKYVRKHTKRYNEEGGYNAECWCEEVRMVSLIALGCSYFGIILYLMFGFTDMLSGFFNPEYWAFLKITSLVSGLK